MKTFHAWKQQGRGEIFDATMERVRQWQPEEADRIVEAAEAPQRKTAAQKAVRQEEEWTAAKDKRRGDRSSNNVCPQAGPSRRGRGGSTRGAQAVLARCTPPEEGQD